VTKDVDNESEINKESYFESSFNGEEEETCEILNLLKKESALAVQGYIGDTSIEFLVDTGASCTLISEEIYDKLLQDGNCKPKKISKSLKMADGTPLPVRGKLEADIKMGDVEVTHEVIGAKINDQGILGYDFMKLHNCLVDVGAGEMQVEGQKIPCIGDTDGVVLRVKETVVLFPEAEQIIEVNSDGAEMAEGEYLLVESIPKCQEKYGIEVAASLISREAKQSAVRIRNPLAEEVTLYKGTRIAEAHPVQVLSVFDKEDEADHNQEKIVPLLRDFKSNSHGPSELFKKLEQEDSNQDFPEVPVHLRDLHEKSIRNIRSREKRLVKDLFWKFKDVFQTDKMDIEKLNSQFGEREIQTGNAAPIIQRPRRTPTAFQRLTKGRPTSCHGVASKDQNGD
jgi:predicted aspartyl protease